MFQTSECISSSLSLSLFLILLSFPLVNSTTSLLMITCTSTIWNIIFRETCTLQKLAPNVYTQLAFFFSFWWSPFSFRNFYIKIVLKLISMIIHIPWTLEMVQFLCLFLFIYFVLLLMLVLDHIYKDIITKWQYIHELNWLGTCLAH